MKKDNFTVEIEQNILALCKRYKQYLPFSVNCQTLCKSFNKGMGSLELAQFINGFTFVNKNALFRNDLQRIKEIAPTNEIILVPNFDIWSNRTLKGTAKDQNLF